MTTKLPFSVSKQKYIRRQPSDITNINESQNNNIVEFIKPTDNSTTRPIKINTSLSNIIQSQKKIIIPNMKKSAKQSLA